MRPYHPPRLKNSLSWQESIDKSGCPELRISFIFPNIEQTSGPGRNIAIKGTAAIA